MSRDAVLGAARTYVVAFVPEAKQFTGHYRARYNEESSVCPACATPLGTAEEAVAGRKAVLFHMRDEGFAVIVCPVCEHLTVTGG